MGGKKKKTKCGVCMSRKHDEDDCPCVVDDCSMDDACRKWCMVVLCTNFQKVSCKLHDASSYEKMQRALEKLYDFEEDLDNAYEWLDDHTRDQKNSCSSRKKVCILQKACERFRDTYKDVFKESSNDDDDDEGWLCIKPIIHQVGIPKMEEKEVQKEVGQESLEEPLDTPSLPLEYAHRVGEVDPLLKIGPPVSFESEDYCAIVCEEKHVFIPFETMVSEQIDTEDVRRSMFHSI